MACRVSEETTVLSRLTAKKVQGLGTYEREAFAKFRESGKVRLLLRAQLAFVVAIHQVLHSLVSLLRQARGGNALNPLQGCVNG